MSRIPSQAQLSRAVHPPRMALRYIAFLFINKMPNALLLCTLLFLAPFSWPDNFCYIVHIQSFALE